MSLDSTYRVQDGCANCRHVFVREEHDHGDELYCKFGAPERPPCMSRFMDESISVTEIFSGKLEEGYEKWDAWKEIRSVVPQGICAEWSLKSDP